MPRINLVSPAGRIVSGSVSKPNLKDMYGALREKPQYFIALAVPKNTPQIPQLFQTIFQHALSEFSRHHDVLRRINLGLQKNTGFAWKIEDGDMPSIKTSKVREGWQGCWVFKLSTTIAPLAVDVNNQPIDPAAIETGYYADVAFSVAGNDHADHTAGLYMNPNFVRLLGYGERINTGPTPDQAFGAAGQSMGSPTPLSPAGMPGGYAAPAAQPQGMPGIGYGGGAMMQPTPAPMGNGYAPTAAPGMPMGYGAPSSALTPAPQSPSMYAAPVAAMPQQSPATQPQGNNPGPLGFASTAVPPVMPGMMGGGLAGSAQPSSPLALPANVPDVQGGATLAPAPTLGMTPPDNISGTVALSSSDAPAPSILGFSSGAAQ
jgi:hypothetical protein